MSIADELDERLRIEFNDWARAGRGESMERGHRPVGAQAIELMDISESSRVLDVGCGSGWATRLIAQKVNAGKVCGIDISDEMIRIAREASTAFANIEFSVSSAEHIPYPDREFTHVFSMESLYYYTDMLTALREIVRVLVPGGLFVSVVDLYRENRPSLQWVEQLKLPVQVLSVAGYRELFEKTGLTNISDRRLYDPTPVPEDYTRGSFNSRDDLIEYKSNGSLMISGEVSQK